MRLALLLILLAAPLHAQAQERLPIIDMHLHAYEAWEPEATDSTWIPLHLDHPLTDEALMEQSLRAMEEHDVALAVTAGLRQHVMGWHAADPERIVPALQFNALPEDLAPFLDSLRTWHANGELMVIGELGTQYGGLGPDNPALEPLFALAEELDIPVAIHMGLGPPGRAYWPPHTYRMSLSDPLLLEDVLVRHPNLRLYVMHAGWPMLDEMVGLLWAYPNVYVDVGVINWLIPRAEFHHYLRRLVGAGFGTRIMFGSDQMNWPGAIGLAIEGVESAEFLTEEQKRDIFYNNAARFLRLSPEEVLKHHRE